MQYFQTRFETIVDIATQCGFDGLAGYLILARHTTGRTILDYQPHQLSGAGVNSIHEKLGCSEARANSILNRLIEAKFVTPAPQAAKAAAPRSARWLLPKQYPLDVDLPHAFVDPPKISDSAVTSPLKRLKKMKPLEGLSQSAANCDATMLLISIYASVEMSTYGGLPFTNTLYRQWDTLTVSKSDLNNCFTWSLEPELEHAFLGFMHKSLPYVEDEAEVKKRFWQAFRNLKNAGLIYEAVSAFSESGQLIASLRINDFHAGSIDNGRVGDSSLLKELERSYGTRLAFYSNEEGTLRVTLPFKTGKIYGIYRPRIRPSNEDVGAWAEAEEERVDNLFHEISAELINDFDDDF